MREELCSDCKFEPCEADRMKECRGNDWNIFMPSKGCSESRRLEWQEKCKVSRIAVRNINSYYWKKFRMLCLQAGITVSEGLNSALGSFDEEFTKKMLR